MKGKGLPTEEEVMAYSLSEDDIRKMLPGLKIFPYPQFHDMDSINEAFDNQGRALFLYLTEDESTGHWVCMMKHGDTIEYFDPYGDYGPDEEAEWLPKSKLRELDQDVPRLTQLLKKSGYKVKKNPYKFQKVKHDNNTCGRHCVTRLYLRNLPLEKYKDVVTSTEYTPDKFVSYFTYDLLRK
jgi:hypothetical protein